MSVMVFLSMAANIVFWMFMLVIGFRFVAAFERLVDAAQTAATREANKVKFDIP